MSSANWLPTYEYNGNRVSALFEGKVIATGDSFAKVSCTAEEYLDSLRKERKEANRQEKKRTATHIQTPNGIRGEILSRTASVFGEEITVRFDNGQIRRLETAGGDQEIEYTKVAKTSSVTNPGDELEARLSATYDYNRQSLTDRLNELADIRRTSGNLITNTESVSEQQKISGIALSAQAEQEEIKEVLAHLDDVEAQNATPPTPVYAAVEQASMGRGDSWIEVIAREMIAESEGQDFEKLLSEGPLLLTSSLDDGTLAHAGTVRELASDHVMGKTAGFEGTKVEEYREKFVTAAEVERRKELKRRTTVAAKRVEAATQAAANLPDEFLFGA